jgi:putative transposase
VKGTDGHKRIKGRKRVLLVDTLGLLLGVVVVPANWNDRDLLKPLLYATPFSPSWQRLVADGGFASPAAAHFCQSVFGIDLCIVTRPKVHDAKRKGFTPLPCRWVVERTFAWIGRYRRFAKDYEMLPCVSETLITLAFIRLLVNRLANPS